jgi:hypothetical protein
MVMAIAARVEPSSMNIRATSERRELKRKLLDRSWWKEAGERRLVKRRELVKRSKPKRRLLKKM